MLLNFPSQHISLSEESIFEYQNHGQWTDCFALFWIHPKHDVLHSYLFLGLFQFALALWVRHNFLLHLSLIYIDKIICKRFTCWALIRIVIVQKHLDSLQNDKRQVPRFLRSSMSSWCWCWKVVCWFVRVHFDWNSLG